MSKGLRWVGVSTFSKRRVSRIFRLNDDPGTLNFLIQDMPSFLLKI